MWCSIFRALTFSVFQYFPQYTLCVYAILPTSSFCLIYLLCICHITNIIFCVNIPFVFYLFPCLPFCYRFIRGIGKRKKFFVMGLLQGVPFFKRVSPACLVCVNLCIGVVVELSSPFSCIFV